MKPPELSLGAARERTNDARLAVLGAGSWGTALAVHWARHGHSVRLWARSPDHVTAMRESRRSHYLPRHELPKAVTVTHRLEDCAQASTVVIAVPYQTFREVLRGYLASAGEGARTIVSGTKGIETETLARMSQVTFEEAVRVHRDLDFAVLSGPSFADELVDRSPTAAVIASADVQVAARMQQLLSAGNLRLYSSSDVVGVEIGGTAKNVVAIASGVINGLGMGHNTRAALMTRGLHEITRLGLACGGRPRTFSGLAGMGDLVLTCTGGQSRNRRTGELLAQGLELARVEQEIGMVAEGVKNALALTRLAAQRRVEMPITSMMYRVLYQGKPVREAIEELMSRDLKVESEL